MYNDPALFHTTSLVLNFFKLGLYLVDVSLKSVPGKEKKNESKLRTTIPHEQLVPPM